MSTPPVSASPSPAFYFTPSVSHWGARSVVMILGLGALGLALYAIYRRYGLKPDRSDGAPAATFIKPDTKADPTFSLDQQHTSQLTHQGKPCLNETRTLPFQKFSEGFIRILPAKLFQGQSISRSADFTVRCCYGAQEFFVYQGKATATSTVEFFMPNMPFSETMGLQIHVGDGLKIFQKKVDLSVNKMRGFYHIESASDISMELPDRTETSLHPLDPPLPIQDSSPFHLYFTREGKIRVEPAESTQMNFVNQRGRTIAYLKLITPDAGYTYEKKEVALVLPFHLFGEGSMTTSPSSLIKFWQQTYRLAAHRDAKKDLQLVLSEIQLTTYI